VRLQLIVEDLHVRVQLTNLLAKLRLLHHPHLLGTSVVDLLNAKTLL
jgi:hypothetical protein